MRITGDSLKVVAGKMLLCTPNTIIFTDWSNMENAGAVFFPAAGSRHGTSVYSVGSNGYYWSATYSGSSGSDYAYCLYFDSSDLYPESSYNGSRYGGHSVRLVKNVQ